ncbi:MAG: RNA polymerase factor sigma-54 [Gammaproteobacteria bacterium]|nr:RNA polymerase factor sigma-54 [Gammaproteobacteria bacterium]NNM01180.1 RNA polymerase factor sigma-54 [Gammaproteobacteria bacterium]
MKQSLQLKLGQSLTMTPQLQQAIRLLQLSSMELGMEVQQALESNMMLELADDGDAEAGESSAASDDSDGAGLNGAEDAEVNAADEKIPEELPVDSQWEDIYDSMPVATPGATRDTRLSSEYDNLKPVSETLQEHLLWQINMSPMTERDRAIAMAIIDSINIDGYLDMSVEDIRETLGSDEDMEVEADEIEAVLKQVQSLDPAGVAARDLGESLCLQMRQVDAATPWLAEAQKICCDYLDMLAAHDYAQIMRRMKLSEDDLRAVIDLIQSMNPRPGAMYSDVQAEYIVPDVYVRKVKGTWRVELNVEAVPRLRVNSQYANMIRRADNSPDNNSLKSHLQEARWFIKSLQSRSETLLKVAAVIVDRQQGFLEYGEEAMKPLVLHDVAEVLEMHESTISRVTTRKYMHTPRGIFELKYFFSSHVSTTLGGEASSTAIRAVIKKLIAAENVQKPLSDNKLAKLLSDQGVQVARRTVAKYREAMAIPPSNERKRLS